MSGLAIRSKNIMNNLHNHWTFGGTGIKNFYKSEYPDYIKALSIFEQQSIYSTPVFEIRLADLNGNTNTNQYSFHWTDVNNKVDTAIFFTILRTIMVLKEE